MSADKLRGHVLLFSRILLVLLSLVGLAGWSYLTLLSLAWSGFRMPVLQAFVLAFPFVYLLLTLLACFIRMRKRTLVLLGIGMNLPLVITNFYFIFTRSESVIVTGICFAFIILWLLLCLAQA